MGFLAFLLLGLIAGAIAKFILGCDDVLGHSLGGVSENECYV